MAASFNGNGGLFSGVQREPVPSPSVPKLKPILRNILEFQMNRGKKLLFSECGISIFFPSIYHNLKTNRFA